VIRLRVDRLTWAALRRLRGVHRSGIVSRRRGSIHRGGGDVIGTDGDVVALAVHRFTRAILGRFVIRSTESASARGFAVRSSRPGVIVSQLGPCCDPAARRSIAWAALRRS